MVDVDATRMCSLRRIAFPNTEIDKIHQFLIPGHDGYGRCRWFAKHKHKSITLQSHEPYLFRTLR